MAKKTTVAAMAAALAAVLIFVLIYLYYGAYSGTHRLNGSAALDSAFPVGRLMIGNSTYFVYVANSTLLQQEGYMNATGIGDCRGMGRCAGMLFLFSNDSIQCFWMKNTLFRMNQSWISDGRINYAYEGLPLSMDNICSRGSMVLETNLSFPIRLGENIAFLGYG